RQVISARIWARRKHIPAGRSTIRLIKAVARRAAISAALLASLLPSVGDAEEGGSGHYLPGSTADFLDILPSEPGFAYASFPLFYQGSVGRGRSLELGGQVAANVSATIFGEISLLLYQSPWKLLDGKHATGIAIPYLWMDVKGSVQAGPLSRNAHDTANGISDVEFFPLMLVWSAGD